MSTAVWIAVGGALGTLARYGLVGLINQRGYPWGTVAVNIVGSFALGVLVGLWGAEHTSNHQLALSIGVLGGFTTFSTFALDTISVWQNGSTGLAVVTVVVSVAAGIGAAVMGIGLGRAMAV
jgi:CrcB protein